MAALKKSHDNVRPISPNADSSSPHSVVYSTSEFTITRPLIQKTSNSPTGSYHERHPIKDSKPVPSDLPDNFAEVVKGVYRSAFPEAENLPALKKLGLKTIITLVDTPYTPRHVEFIKENGIVHRRIILVANKDLSIKSPDVVFNQVLEILLNKANHPILVHCNKGKHRTGCTIACFRRLQGWSLQDAINEYLKFSFPKSRELDQRFIEAYNTATLAGMAQRAGAALWKPAVVHMKSQSDQNERERPSPRRRIETSRSEVVRVS